MKSLVILHTMENESYNNLKYFKFATSINNKTSPVLFKETHSPTIT